MASKINIHLYEDRDTADVDITEDSIIKHKLVSLTDLEQCFLRSKGEEKMRFEGLMPEGLISYSCSVTESYIVLRYPAQKMTYFSTFADPYPDFPMPNLAFGILMNKDHMILRTFLRVLPQGHLTLDSPLYYYPFSNVYDNGEICMGKNEALTYDHLQSLENYPPYVLTLPNNADLFANLHNKRGWEYKELLHKLAKKKPDYYYKNVLVRVPGQTLKDFCTLGGKII